MKKPIIAVDIDDVLAANAKAFVEYTNRMWGLSLAIDDYDEHWAKVWGTDNDETARRAEAMHAEGVFANHEHFPEAVTVLRKLADSYKLVIVTSRRKSIEVQTVQWVENYFGDIFSNIHFAGIWDKITDSSIHMTKAEVLCEIGAIYLIDDQLKHCLAADQQGVRAVLFGDYAWNQSAELPTAVTRCRDWNEVAEYFGV